MKPFWVYILECSDGRLYVGQTDDLEKRLSEHQAGLDAYTATRLPVSLIFSENYPDRDATRKREKQLKGWSRAKKLALIGGEWSKVQSLAKKPRFRGD